MMKSLCAILGEIRRGFPPHHGCFGRKAARFGLLTGRTSAVVWLLSAGLLAAQTVSNPPPALLVERAARMYGFSSQEAEELKTKGELTRFTKGLNENLLVPDEKIGRAVVERLKGIDPSITAEAVFLLPLPSKDGNKEDLDLFIFNTLRSIRSMKGIEYYSASRKRMRVMFNDAFAIADPESRTPLPDPIEKHVLPESVIYVYQHDSSFGKNAYEMRYAKHGSIFQLSMKNLTEMYYGIAPLVDPGSLLIDLVVIPADDHILFYGCIGVKTFSLLWFEQRVNESFTNRIRALYSWFSREFVRGAGG